MILPTTAVAVWILAIVSLLCLGSWANTLKLAGKWRFEYYYYDFVLGILVCAGVAAFVLGSGRPQELTFQDNLLLTGYRKMAWVLGQRRGAEPRHAPAAGYHDHRRYERGVSLDPGRGAGDRRGVGLRHCLASQRSVDVHRNCPAAGRRDCHRPDVHPPPAGPARRCADRRLRRIHASSRSAPSRPPGRRWQSSCPLWVESR